MDGEAAFRADADRWPSLVRRIGQSDGEAEAELAREFHPRVVMVASLRLHGSDAAQDIAQDTMAAVLQALRAGALREPAKLPGFVLGIARNLINNHYRLEARSRETHDDLPDPPARAEPGRTDFDDERRALVREALKCLKPADRHILILTLIEGMSPREIAPLVNLTSEQVRTRKTRAVRTIAAEIEKLTRKGRRYHLGTSGLR